MYAITRHAMYVLIKKGTETAGVSLIFIIVIVMIGGHRQAYLNAGERYFLILFSLTKYKSSFKRIPYSISRSAHAILLTTPGSIWAWSTYRSPHVLSLRPIRYRSVSHVCEALEGVTEIEDSDGIDRFVSISIKALQAGIEASTHGRIHRHARYKVPTETVDNSAEVGGDNGKSR